MHTKIREMQNAECIMHNVADKNHPVNDFWRSD